MGDDGCRDREHPVSRVRKLRYAMSLWTRFFRPERAKDDLDAEIESHLALAAAEKRERGATAEQAKRDAEQEFGNQALVKDVARSMWGWAWLEALERDVIYALRQLRRS